jgi:hypothetical protein
VPAAAAKTFETAYASDSQLILNANQLDRRRLRRRAYHHPSRPRRRLRLSLPPLKLQPPSEGRLARLRLRLYLPPPPLRPPKPPPLRLLKARRCRDLRCRLRLPPPLLKLQPPSENGLAGTAAPVHMPAATAAEAAAAARRFAKLQRCETIYKGAAGEKRAMIQPILFRLSGRYSDPL